MRDYMRLDKSALSTLNIFPVDRVRDKVSRFVLDCSIIPSIFGLLNCTVTAGIGERLLRRWLNQPLVSPKPQSPLGRRASCSLKIKNYATRYEGTR